MGRFVELILSKGDPLGSGRHPFSQHGQDSGVYKLGIQYIIPCIPKRTGSLDFMAGILLGFFVSSKSIALHRILVRSQRDFQLKHIIRL